MEPQKTQNTQNVGGALVGLGYVLNLEAGLAGVEQQAEMQGGSGAPSGRSDDSHGQKVSPVLAGIHLRVRRILRWYLPCLLPVQPCQLVDGCRGVRAGRSRLMIKPASI